MEIRKTPSEEEIVSLLIRGEICFPPFELEVEQTEASARRSQADAVLRFRWRNRQYRFVAECNRLWTPKALSQLVDQVRRYARPPEYYPLVVTPYLPDARLAELEAEGVSGIDLCGNGVVVIPNELLVYRTGKPNRFRAEAEIKNVFRGSSSLVARVFLLVPKFGSVREAEREIESRGGGVVLATVSKVYKTLEGLLVIENTRVKGTAARQLKLLQPEKLLDLLAENYVAPQVTRTLQGKTRLAPDEFRAALSRVGEEVRLVQTGFGSVGSYAVMAKEPMQYFYCSNLDATHDALGDAFEPTDRFANVSLGECKDDTVYFDRRAGLVASPVQTYLELVTGDKRSQETAEQVRRTVLTPLVAQKG